MRDDLPDWLEADPEPRRPRRTVFWILAVAPWVLVLAMAVASGRADDGTSTPATHEAVPPHPAGGHPPRDPDTAVVGGATDHEQHASDLPGGHAESGPGPLPGGPVQPPLPTERWMSEHRANWRVAAGDGETAAVAVAVARAWLTGVGPALAVEGVTAVSGTTYVEHLAVEAVERPDAGAAVVTLLAVVLDAGEEAAVRVVRLGVPVRELTDGPRPAGPPWYYPSPDLSTVPLPTERVEDPDLQLAAREALTRSGFDRGGQPELLALERSDGWPWIARLRTADPTGEAWEGAVWLRRHLDGFAVAGLPLVPDGQHDPASSGPDPARIDPATSDAEVEP